MYLYSLPNNVLNKQLDEVTQSMTEVVTLSLREVTRPMTIMNTRLIQP